MKLELGALEFNIEVKNGELINNTPRLNILQDNLKEIVNKIPNGKYKWVMILDIDKAEKENLS